MKKFLLFIAFTLITITVSAQAPFTTYQPAPSNNNSNSYQGTNPFTYYRPYGYNKQAPQSRSKTYNLTGYYYDSKRWHQTPIKVTVIEDQWILSAYKYGRHWINNSALVGEVDYYDSDVVKENFNYKAKTIHLGIVYF